MEVGKGCVWGLPAVICNQKTRDEYHFPLYLHVQTKHWSSSKQQRSRSRSTIPSLVSRKSSLPFPPSGRSALVWLWSGRRSRSTVASLTISAARQKHMHKMVIAYITYQAGSFQNDLLQSGINNYNIIDVCIWASCLTFDSLVNLRKRRREKDAAGEDEFNITEVIITECYNKFPHRELYYLWVYYWKGDKATTSECAKHAALKKMCVIVA